MTASGVGPITFCPFALCEADVTLVVEQKSAGDDESTQLRIPLHQLEGPARRFGGCPASLMLLPLDEYSTEQLVAQFLPLRRMVDGHDGPPSGTAPTPERRHSLAPRVNPDHELIRQANVGPPKRPTAGPVVPQQGKAGRGVVPLPDEPHAGPGAGRASTPYPPRATDIVEQVVPPKLTVVPKQTESRGNNMDDDLRSQLVALTNLAIEGFGQQQEQCSSMTEALEGFELQVRALADKQEATHTLALAAVGGAGNIPDSAANMIGSSSSIASALDQMAGTVVLIKTQVEVVYGRAAVAADNGRQYLAVI